ncbi:MAG TPA: AI-2E family transporter [Saprospiraceae bacterium]|nr:AI-2E family transporter [Saprospiraceae bacterium]HNT20304.1 AI-2E family transporter [Saprospiraceae bacterium]
MQTNARTIWIVILSALGLYLLYYFSDLVSFILASWVLSMLGQPIMKLFLEKLKLNKFSYGTSVAAVMTILLYILAILLIGVLFIPIIIEQASHLANIDYDKIGASLQPPITYINNELQSLGLISSEQSVMDQIFEVVQKWFRPERVSNIFGSIIQIGSNLTLAVGSIIFITFFFLQESGLFQEYLVAIVPKRHEEKISHILSDASRLLRRYFSGILIQGSIFCLISYIALTLFGVRNALLIGFFGGLMNVIPYVGPIIGMIFAAFITLTGYVGADFSQVILPLCIKAIGSVFIAQVIDNWLVQPFLFSKTVKAHPLEIFLVILIAAKIGGITGMILAIPAYTVLRVVAKAFLSEYKIVKKITEDMADQPLEIPEEAPADEAANDKP